jgi:hypothetical protein
MKNSICQDSHQADPSPAINEAQVTLRKRVPERLGNFPIDRLIP